MLTAYDFGTRSTPIDLELITYDGRPLKTIAHDVSYPYLGFDISLSGAWTTEFSKIESKTLAIATALHSHKFTESQGEYLFRCSAVPLFRYSVTVAPWSVAQCRKLTDLWVMIMKKAWHLSPGTVRCLFSYPSDRGGMTAPQATAIATKELSSHLQHCCLYPDSLFCQVHSTYSTALSTTLALSLSDMVWAAPYLPADLVYSNTILRLARYCAECGINISWGAVSERRTLSWCAILTWVLVRPEQAHFFMELSSYERAVTCMYQGGYRSPLDLPCDEHWYVIPRTNRMRETDRLALQRIVRQLITPAPAVTCSRSLYPHLVDTALIPSVPLDRSRIRIYKHVMELLDKHSRIRLNRDDGGCEFRERACNLEILHQIISDLDSTMHIGISESLVSTLDDDELTDWTVTRSRVRTVLWPGAARLHGRRQCADRSEMRHHNITLMVQSITAQRSHSTRKHVIYRCKMYGNCVDELVSLSDTQLRRAAVERQVVLILPTEWYPDWPDPPAVEYGWWVQICQDDHDGGTVLARSIEPRFEHHPLSPLTMDAVRRALNRAPQEVHQWMSLSQLGYPVRRTRFGCTEFLIRGKSRSISNFLPSFLLRFLHERDPDPVNLPSIYRRMLRKLPRRSSLPVHPAFASRTSSHDHSLGVLSRHFRPASQYHREAFSHLPTSLPDLTRIGSQ